MHEFPPYNKVKVCRHGIMAFNPRDAYVGRSLDLYGEFAEEEIALLARAVREGSVALDVGACIGTHTVPLARAVGARGVVHAFEPQRLLFQTLCANLALNSITNVHAHRVAVSSHPTTLFAQEIDPRLAANYAGFPLHREPPGEPVPSIALDGLGLDRVEVVKVDVEGMEQSVIEGAAQTIRRWRPLLYVESDRPESREMLLACLAQMGYRVYWHTPRLFNPDNFFKRRDNAFGDIASLNLLCLPEGGRWRIEDFAGLAGLDPHPLEVPTGSPATDRRAGTS